MRHQLLFALVIFSSTATVAEDFPNNSPVPEMPLAVQNGEPMDADTDIIPANEGNIPDETILPMPIQDGEPMEADITITRRGEKTIHEYRVNGKITKIKVIPDIGPAYYFLDPDGDGQMEEVNASDLDTGIRINQWKIFSW